LRLQKILLSFKNFNTSQFVNDSKLIITAFKSEEGGGDGGGNVILRRHDEKEHRLKGLSGQIRLA
jgi:hypothetical protein